MLLWERKGALFPYALAIALAKCKMPFCKGFALIPKPAFRHEFFWLAEKLRVEVERHNIAANLSASRNEHTTFVF